MNKAEQKRDKRLIILLEDGPEIEDIFQLMINPIVLSPLETSGETSVSDNLPPRKGEVSEKYGPVTSVIEEGNTVCSRCESESRTLRRYEYLTKRYEKLMKQYEHLLDTHKLLAQEYKTLVTERLESQ